MNNEQPRTLTTNCRT